MKKRVILENKIAKILNKANPRNLRPLKICTYTVFCSEVINLKHKVLKIMLINNVKQYEHNPNN